MNLLSVMTRKAAKAHKCCECGRVIAKGDKHETWQGNWQKALATFRTCALCAAVRWHWFKAHGKDKGNPEATLLGTYVGVELGAKAIVMAAGDNEALIKAYALKHGVLAGETLT